MQQHPINRQRTGNFKRAPQALEASLALIGIAAEQVATLLIPDDNAADFNASVRALPPDLRDFVRIHARIQVLALGKDQFHRLIASVRAQPQRVLQRHVPQNDLRDSYFINITSSWTEETYSLARWTSTSV